MGSHQRLDMLSMRLEEVNGASKSDQIYLYDRVAGVSSSNSLQVLCLNALLVTVTEGCVDYAAETVVPPSLHTLTDR